MCVSVQVCINQEIIEKTLIHSLEHTFLLTEIY